MISLEGKVKSISNPFHILHLTFYKERLANVKQTQAQP